MLEEVPSEVLKSLLSRGSVLQVPSDASMDAAPTVTGAVMVAADATAVFDVIADLEAYPQFMPQTDRVKVVERRGNEWITDHRIKLKFGVISMKLVYMLTYTVDRENLRVEYRHRKGALSSVKGGWQIKSLEPGLTAVGYSLTMDFREAGFVARKAISVEPALQTALQVSTVSMTLGALKERVEGKR
jgi:ribosome-associated toxin RatA of RatAB toxin-antitoxin module